MLLRHRHFAVHRFEPDDKTIGMKSDEKDPSWCDHSGGLVRTHTARTRGLRGWEAPGIFQFEPGNFLRLYQTAHSKSIVDKWDNFALGPRWSAA